MIHQLSKQRRQAKLSLDVQKFISRVPKPYYLQFGLVLVPVPYEYTGSRRPRASCMGVVSGGLIT